MAPSRGNPPSNFAASAHATSTEPSPSEDAVIHRGDTALASAMRNLLYLISPCTSTERPFRPHTRAFLRTLRYISIFVFWRVIRYAKYIAIAALAAAVGSTDLRGVASGVGFLVAPPTLGVSISAGTV